MYLWARIVGERVLALWSSANAGLRVRLYDGSTLLPIELEPSMAPLRVRSSATPTAELVLRRLEAGTHAAPRSPWIDVAEILLLGESLPDLGETDPARAAIYAWHPQRGEVTVHPQRWFPAATMDLGYQWITRIARHPTTGRFVGDGIRIDIFELDETGTQIARSWPA
jgi:hypothetical protein